MFKKGQRVRYIGLDGRHSDGIIVEDQTSYDYAYVKYDGSAFMKSCSCAYRLYLLDGPIASAELCLWVINNLLTEEQLDVVREGESHSLRYTR